MFLEALKSAILDDFSLDQMFIGFEAYFSGSARKKHGNFLH